jgi:hypothetical protein
VLVTNPFGSGSWKAQLEPHEALVDAAERGEP